METTAIQFKQPGARTRRSEIGFALMLLVLVIVGLSTEARADKFVKAEAQGKITATGGLGIMVNDFGSAPPDVNPLVNKSASPWTIPYRNPEHGMWMYADDTGRTRAYARTGLRSVFPGSTSGDVLVIWEGTYNRTDAANPEFTINRSWLEVFAQTAGPGFLAKYSGDEVSAPYANWTFIVDISPNPYARHVFIHEVGLGGIVDARDNPLEVHYNEGADRTSGSNTGNPFSGKDFEEPISIPICVPDAYYGGVECSVREVSLRFEIPATTREIDLSEYEIEVGDDYTIRYLLNANVGEDTSEQYAEAILGDPLDIDTGGFSLETTHPQVPGNARFCGQTPDPTRFANHGDGTVTDNYTGLMWQRCPSGHVLDENGTTADLGDDLCVPGAVTEFDWQAGLQTANGDGFASFNDWQMPNAKQLESLVELSCLSPAIDTLAFPDTPPAPFWTSTPAVDGAEAWQLSFLLGDLYPAAKDQLALLRPVRQSGATPVVPSPALIPGDVSVDEGDSGTSAMNFLLVLTRPSSTDVSVDYATVPRSATAGDDYESVSGTVTIPAGEQYTTIAVTVNGDVEAEDDESLLLALSNPTGGAYIAKASSLGTIIDDESVVSIVTEQPEQAEGDSGTVNYPFTVILDKPAVTTINLDYASGDLTATSAVDYTASSGTLTINVGEDSASILVAVVGDTQAENDETFELTISNVIGGAKLGSATATAVIVDDDGAGSYQALNDTGVVDCATVGAARLACPQAGYPVQDGETGRDVTDNDSGDGLAGFSFTKLDSGGVALTNQAATYPYVNVPPNSSQALWDCVRDEVTGLTWEIKRDTADDLRHYSWTYSWFNSTGINDGGEAGIENGGVCVDGINCDTEKYVAAVNATNLCGFNDWRIPRTDELFTLAVAAPLSVFALRGLDSNYFPHNYSTTTRGDKGYTYWSSTSNVYSPELARALTFQDNYPLQGQRPKQSPLPLQLVRGGSQ